MWTVDNIIMCASLVLTLCTMVLFTDMAMGWVNPWVGLGQVSAARRFLRVVRVTRFRENMV